MTLRWLVLADAYLDRGRTLLKERLDWLREHKEITEGQSEFHRRSRASLSLFLEAVVGGSGAEFEDLERFKRMSEEDLAVFKEIATDLVRMHFLRAIVHDAAFTPPALCFELVRGAVYTVNPSYNREWMEGIARVDPTRAASVLLSFIRNGTAFETGGAANASYWFGCFASEAEVRAFSADLRESCLVRFVETDDVDLRRCLVANISWNPAHYAPRVRSLLKRAAGIAGDHPDDYIRERYQVDTGQSPPAIQPEVRALT
jgi:hypothetical protein